MDYCYKPLKPREISLDFLADTIDLTKVVAVCKSETSLHLFTDAATYRDFIGANPWSHASYVNRVEFHDDTPDRRLPEGDL